MEGGHLAGLVWFGALCLEGGLFWWRRGRSSSCEGVIDTFVQGGRGRKRFEEGAFWPERDGDFEGFLSRVCDVESMGCEGRSKGPVMVGFWYEDSHGVRDRSKRFMSRAYLGCSF